MKNINTLALTVHPDDFEGIFATVSRVHVAQTHVMVMTDGDHGQDFERSRLCRR
jgi:LmbE family N-acetylglucosaminyl deacetylase